MKRIIIFGAGTEGMKALEKLGEERVSFFCDNFRKGYIRSKEVIDFKKLCKIWKDYRILLAVKSETYRLQIRRQLDDAHIYYSDPEDVYDEIVKEIKAGFEQKNSLIPIEENNAKEMTSVSDYWTGHTVYSDYFLSAKQSLDYRESIFKLYPQYREFADMDRMHQGEMILDYGCGTGNDLVWYTQRSDPEMIIGMDVSETALKIAQYRMALHEVSSEHCRLIRVDDNLGKIPIEDSMVDFVNCQGCLQHTSHPQKILREFFRVLKGDEHQGGGEMPAL